MRNEHDGWAVAIDTTAGYELRVARYVGAELVPSPPEVAQFVGAVFEGRAPEAAPVGDQVRRHLATYAIPYQERAAHRPGTPVERARRPAR